MKTNEAIILVVYTALSYWGITQIINNQNTMESIIQQIPAGLTDQNWEIFATARDKVWINIGGRCLPFEEWPLDVYYHYRHELAGNAKFAELTKKMGAKNDNEAVKLYCFMQYGELDNTPDYIPSQNKSNPENWQYNKFLKLVGRSVTNTEKKEVKFTIRQLQIIQAMITGKPNKIIANELGIEPNTMIAHSREIFKKAGVQNKVELVTYAYKIGLVA